MATYYTIAQVLDSINGEVVGTGGFSDFSYLPINTGDKGSEFKEKINVNFFNNAGDHQAFYDTFQVVVSALNKRIISEDIKQVKIENGDIYYTSDGTTWSKWVDVTWSKISGPISGNVVLQEALDDKATVRQFNTLSSSVSAISSTVTEHTNTLSNHTSRINTLEDETEDQGDDIEQLQNDVRLRVNGNGIKQIKESAGRIYFSLQDTTDPNPTWTPITVGTSAQVSWGNVTGTVTNQLDLIEYLGLNYSTQTALNTHTGNTNNPHSVTKAQVGLGNVDNTSDMNKPISTAVSNALGALKDKASYNTEQQAIWDVLNALPTTYATITSLTAHTSNTNNPHSVTKAQVGLGNVDNTSDLNKPISTAVAAALAGLLPSQSIGSIESVVVADYFDLIDNDSIDPTGIYLVYNS